MAATGASAINANIAAEVQAMAKAAQAGLLTTGLHAAEDAAGRAPVVTGHLRRSFLGGADSIGPEGIRTGETPEGPYVEFGSRTVYAADVEYTDRPMIRPASHDAEAVLREQTAGNVRRTLSRRSR